MADFSHEVGHACIHCHAIREIGPAHPRNTLARMITRAMGKLVEPSHRSKRDLANEARSDIKLRKRQLRFLRAVRAA